MYDIIYDGGILAVPALYDIVKKKLQYHKNDFKPPFLRYFHGVLLMISIKFPMILPKISELRDIIPVFAYDICL